MALAISDVAHRKGKLLIVTDGHTDPATSTIVIGIPSTFATRRGWKLTRLPSCSSISLEKWYFITPDYAFGHTLQKGFEASLKKFGGTEVGASPTPLGTI